MIKYDGVGVGDAKEERRRGEIAIAIEDGRIFAEEIMLDMAARRAAAC